MPSIREIRATAGPIQRFNASTPKAFASRPFNDFSNFPHKARAIFAQYISEAPEMTSSRRGVKEGQNNRRKLNHE
jgi:hypothetical protein